MFSGKFTSKPTRLKLGPNGLDFQRADILVHSVDQAGDSFEGRIFLNNPDANLETPADAKHGYAGSFSVYGHGAWPEKAGDASSKADATYSSWTLSRGKSCNPLQIFPVGPAGSPSRRTARRSPASVATTIGSPSAS